MSEDPLEGIDHAHVLAVLGQLEAEIGVCAQEIRQLQQSYRLLGAELGALTGQLDYVEGLVRSHGHTEPQ